MFVVGVFAFTATSLMCGLAQGEAMLIIGRALQGVGGGGRTDGDGAGRHHIRPRKPRSQAFAIYAAMTGIGSVAGLILGGILTEVSWRLVFLINVPIGLAVGPVRCGRSPNRRGAAVAGRAGGGAGHAGVHAAGAGRQ